MKYLKNLATKTQSQVDKEILARTKRNIERKEKIQEIKEQTRVSERCAKIMYRILNVRKSLFKSLIVFIIFIPVNTWTLIDSSNIIVILFNAFAILCFTASVIINFISLHKAKKDLKGSIEIDTINKLF